MDSVSGLFSFIGRKCATNNFLSPIGGARIQAEFQMVKNRLCIIGTSWEMDTAPLLFPRFRHLFLGSANVHVKTLLKKVATCSVASSEKLN